MSSRRLVIPMMVLASLFGAGCGGGDPPIMTPRPDGGGIVDDTCPDPFRQDSLTDYHVDIAAEEWAALDDEFRNRASREAAEMETSPDHPIEFRYLDGPQLPDVVIRLKGQSSWWQTIALDADPKMQFVIAFNEIDPDGRFLGFRKVELDMPRTDQTFLRQRVALYALRRMGIPAQCANSARLFVNGAYYGLYTNLERMDKEFLQSRFPGAADGDLWKGGRIIKTNELTFSWARLEALWHEVDGVAALDELVDLDAAMHEWAAEAMVGDADGYYNGRPNYYLYDHPTRGFVWIAHDLDTSFDEDFLPASASPMLPICTGRDEGDWMHYLIVMNDEAGAARYIAALTNVRAAYDAGDVEARVDEWSAQIAAASQEDPRKPFTDDAHVFAVSRLRSYISPRVATIDAWLACRSAGGEDADGDGFDFCNDCNDADSDAYPGATEICNGQDDDCDGLIGDEVCP